MLCRCDEPSRFRSWWHVAVVVVVLVVIVGAVVVKEERGWDMECCDLFEALDEIAEHILGWFVFMVICVWLIADVVGKDLRFWIAVTMLVLTIFTIYEILEAILQTFCGCCGGKTPTVRITRVGHKEGGDPIVLKHVTLFWTVQRILDEIEEQTGMPARKQKLLLLADWEKLSKKRRYKRTLRRKTFDPDITLMDTDAVQSGELTIHNLADALCVYRNPKSGGGDGAADSSDSDPDSGSDDDEEEVVSAPAPKPPFSLVVTPVGDGEGQDLITLSDVESTHTIEALKEMIEAQSDTPAKKQSLLLLDSFKTIQNVNSKTFKKLLKKQTLKDGRTLKSYKIGEGTQLCVYTRPPPPPEPEPGPEPAKEKPKKKKKKSKPKGEATHLPCLCSSSRSVLTHCAHGLSMCWLRREEKTKEEAGP
eukprot:COSAG01_NODE_5255_length_4381_cov_301.360813_3_plen_420_part_00